VPYQLHMFVISLSRVLHSNDKCQVELFVRFQHKELPCAHVGRPGAKHNLVTMTTRMRTRVRGVEVEFVEFGTR
jgi:hypothetical protein